MNGRMNSVLAALLILAAGVCAVSAVQLNVGSVTLANVGESGDITLTLDSAPSTGLSGYNVTFTIADPSVAEIVDVKFPDWHSQPDFRSNSTGTNNVNVKVADVEDIIGSSATDIDLGSVTVRGLAAGSSTDITVTVNQVDDDSGNEVTVADAKGTISVQQAPGSIRVFSTPITTGASILVDGIASGSTDTAGTIISGLTAGRTYLVKVSYPGYVDAEQPVTIISGQTVDVTLTLYLPVTINVKTNPYGCDVSFNGIPKGTTDGTTGLATFTAQPGYYSIKVEKTGYLAKWKNQTLYEGRTYSFSFTLAKAPNCVPGDPDCPDTPPYGSISVNSTPMGARIFIDGEDTELETPMWTEIYAGDHSVYVTLGSITSETQRPTVPVHEQVNLDFQLNPALPVKVFIVPRILNIGRGEGKFLAFVRLPNSYRAADVDARSVSCQGAPANRLIRVKAFPHIFAAIFSRDKLVNVVQGDDVKFTVTGTIHTKGKKIVFSGSDSIRVIKRSMKVKEDTDDLDKIKDDEIMKKFKPNDLK